MERNYRKTRIGIVVSDKMDKTIVVAIKENVKHKLYSKIVKRTYKLKAHDEENVAHIGDRVKVGKDVILHHGVSLGADGFSFVTENPNNIEQARKDGEIKDTQAEQGRP